MFKLNTMSACVKPSQSPRISPESRRLKKLNRPAVEANSVAELPQIKDKSSPTERVHVSLLSLQNEQSDFIPDELLTSLTATSSTQGRLDPPKLNRTLRNAKICAIHAPDAVWHREIGRKKHHYFLDQPTSVTGAGRDISFLCDALVAQKHRIILPPMSETNSTPTADTKSVKSLIPSEYHVVKKKGVKALQCIDDKFTVLLEDEDNRLKVFPSMRPSGRLEAVQLMRVMDDMLDKAGVNQEFEELTGLSQMQGLLELVQVEQNIYNVVFHELIRQVSVECAERGQLLAKLRQRYVALLDRIPRQLKGLHTETLAQRALDRRLTEQIVCFKQSIAQLHEELNKMKEHDEQMSKQAERAQEELSKALEQSQHNSDIVGEYHDLYELQRQRLEGQVTTLIEERDLWSKVTYSLALKVIKLNNLQLISRLHVSEQMWNETAEHFAIFIAKQDSEDLNRIMQLTDQYKEQLNDFMEMLRKSERQQSESIRSIQNDIVKWHTFCETNRMSPDVQLEKTTEEELYNDLKQWSKVLTVQCERYGGQSLLSGQETLIRLAQLQESWMKVFLQLFRRHPTPDGEPPQGKAAMMELCHMVTEHHKQLDTRITGESGIHKQLTSLGRGVDFWANKLESLIGRLETLPHTDWLKLNSALESWITLSEEALLNVTSTQPESEKIKEKPHIKIEMDDVFNTLRQFLSSQNNFFEYGNLSLCEEVRSMHMLRTRWMVDLLLLMVPDHHDDQEPPPNLQFNANKDVSHKELEGDARNLSQKLNYLSKYIAGSCQAIVEELIQKNMSQDEAESELKQLSKLQGECSEWVEVSQILLSDLTVSPAALRLTRKNVPQPITVVPVLESVVDEHVESEMQAQAKTLELTADTKHEHGLNSSQKAHEQVQEPRIDEVTDRELRGVVLKLIGHDGHIIEQTLGEERVQLTGTSDLVLRPRTENAQQAFSALATVQVLQQELLAVEARAIKAEERAMEVEEALQVALEKIYELERQLPQSTSPETKVSKNSALGVDKTETTPEPKEMSPKPTTSPKPSKSKKKR